MFESWFESEFRCWQYAFCASDKFEWLDDNKAIEEIIQSKPAVDYPRIHPHGEKIKILQISDIHFDPDYEVGAPVDCPSILCCHHSESSKKQFKGQAAGQLGSLGKCDVPFSLLQQFFDKLQNDPNPPQILLWTGDSPQHNIWEITMDDVSNNLKRITELIKKKYHGQVIPAWGNHGISPNDQLDVNSPSTFALMEQLASAWRSLIGEEAYAQFRNKGYYSVPLTAGLKGRAIVLNSMLHDALNFYLIRDQTDPWEQVEFLKKELHEAEFNGEFVYIVGHIPPGYGYSLDPFNKRYSALVDRYTNIIRGQFYGHIHSDEFKLTQSIARPGHQAGVQFIVPSFTTYTYRNPSYRVYQVDVETGYVYDYEQFRMYLSKDKTEWEIAYKMRDFFDVADGSDYAGFQNFALQMKEDKDLYNKMMRMHASEGPRTYSACKLYLTTQCIRKYMLANS